MDSPFTSIPADVLHFAECHRRYCRRCDTEELDALKTFIASDVYQNIVLTHYNATKVPGGLLNFILIQLQLYHQPNGFFILPLLTAVTQYLMTVINPASTGTQQGTGAPARL